MEEKESIEKALSADRLAAAFFLVCLFAALQLFACFQLIHTPNNDRRRLNKRCAAEQGGYKREAKRKEARNRRDYAVGRGAVVRHRPNYVRRARARVSPARRRRAAKLARVAGARCAS